MNAIESRFTYYRTVTDDETAAAVLVLAEMVRGKRLEVTVKSESGVVLVCNECGAQYRYADEKGWLPSCNCLTQAVAEGVKAVPAK